MGRRLSLSDITGKGNNLPNRYLLHGLEGWGKTSFGAMLPKPIFIQSRGETGLETLISNGRLPETPHFPEAQSWPEILSAVRALDSQHEYKTLVVDTVNGAERLCSEYICATQFKGDWSGFNAYGRGYENSVAEWISFLTALDRVRESRKMILMLLCHTQVRKFKNPEGGDYGRYSPDMNEKIWGVTHKWADVVLFGNFQTVVDKQGKAAGGENRILCCTRTAAYDAKNRVGLPDVLDMGGSPQDAWKAFAAALVAGKQQQTKEEGK